MAGIRTHQTVHGLAVLLSAVHPEHIDADGRIVVVLHQVRSVFRIYPDRTGPPAADDQLKNIVEIMLGLFGDHFLSAVEQPLQGYRTGGVARLVEGHRPHPHLADPSDAGMHVTVVLRDRRTGQNELSQIISFIDLCTHRVPKDRGGLPFVN